ncbi:MAG TPA: ABC transporter permease [Egibacteraceae bacterium]|nr:ABC transporter permease [Actinomycetota bacterium]HWB72786.1 ABC transporter permease [Egibacteraceae bacterium]
MSDHRPTRVTHPEPGGPQLDEQFRLEEERRAEDQAATYVEGGTSSATAATAGLAPGRQASLWSDAWRQLRRNPLFLVSATFIAVFVIMAVRPSLFTDADPRACDLASSLLRPSARHWFGFDLQGCDYYARVLYGARVSVFVGIVTTGFALLIAVVGGSLAGYYGGLVDTLIARVTDVWYAVPEILFAIVILSVLGTRGLRQVTIVLVVLFWRTMLRLMRSSVLSAKEMDYVQAARALGAGDLRILARHILPNAIAPVVVYATITVGIVIAVEATLSFLGVGLQLPAISWGLMINVAQSYLLQAPHLLLFPALFLSVTVFSFILMGDALRDALDPRLR